MGGDGSNAPRLGFSMIEQAELDVRGVAEITELHALYLKLGRQRNRERAEAGEPEMQIDWTGFVKTDFSHLTDEQRQETEKEIADLRADPTFRAELKGRLEESEPELARLMEDDGP